MEKRAFFRNRGLAWLLIAPQLLLVFLFFYWPTAQALYWAFTLEQPWGGGNQWVGLENFEAIFSDGAYWNSIGVSFAYALLATGIAMGGALLLALFVDRQLRGFRAYRSIFVWPYAIAAPAAAVAFRFIFSPDSGMIGALNALWPGLWDPLLNGPQALVMVVLCHAWIWIGYNFIFFLAGLQSIPKSLIEASAMDGSGALRRMVDIQLPLIAPTLFFLMVINLTGSFTDSFGIVDIMTQGGPAKGTEVMVYKIYFDGFKGLDYSGAAAQSIVLMLLVMGLTFVQFRWVERRVHYG